jgi:hypothetical protein
MKIGAGNLARIIISVRTTHAAVSPAFFPTACFHVYRDVSPFSHSKNQLL